MEELPNTLTKEEYESNLQHFNYSCAYCGIKLNNKLNHPDSHNLEHIMPISRDEYDWVEGIGTTQQNCIPTCQDCNTSKGSRTLAEWYLEQEFYSIEILLMINEITTDGKEWIL